MAGPGSTACTEPALCQPYHLLLQRSQKLESVSQAIVNWRSIVLSVKSFNTSTKRRKVLQIVGSSRKNRNENKWNVSGMQQSAQLEVPK